MGLKDLLSKAGERIRSIKFRGFSDYKPSVDNEGLLDSEPQDRHQDQSAQSGRNDTVLVKPASADSRTESLERVQEGFNRLIDQLQNINDNLNRQMKHNQQLMERLDKLPNMFDGFGPAIEDQRKLTEKILQQFNESAARNQQFIEAVQIIPTETAKQTDALEEINHQLSAAAESDSQMAQNFNKFCQSLDKLDHTAANQNDSILQMSRTFAASDRYLKFIISRDKKRMFWLFAISLGICVFVILVLVGIILYLRQ